MNKQRTFHILTIIFIVLVIIIGNYFVREKHSETTENIIGEWSFYLDCPNTIFNFKQDNTVQMENCDGDYQITLKETGTYTIEKEKIFATFPKSGNLFFTLIDEGIEKKLQLTHPEQSLLLFKVQR